MISQQERFLEFHFGKRYPKRCKKLNKHPGFAPKCLKLRF